MKMLRRSQRFNTILSNATQRRRLPTLTHVASPELGFPMPLWSPPSPTYEQPEMILPVPEKTPVPEVPRSSSVEKQPTPMMQVTPNLYAKLEGFNTGGSIKDRAVMQCTMGMLQSGKLRPGDTLCLCTSGNAGRSLLHVQEQLAKKGVEIKVKIFMPKRYFTRVVPSKIAETEGVEVVHGDRESAFYSIPHPGKMSRFLHGLDSEFLESQEQMSKLAKEHGWAVLDQHFDVNSMHAHQSTAEEIFRQVPQMTDVVCTTGTGGTAAGLREYLPPHVNVHARPAKPGAIDGITDVRRYNNFCDVGLLEGFSDCFFDKDTSVDNQQKLQAEFNITAGESSGAAYALAKEIVEADPNAHVVFICADGYTTESALYNSQLSTASNQQE